MKALYRFLLLLFFIGFGLLFSQLNLKFLNSESLDRPDDFVVPKYNLTFLKMKSSSQTVELTDLLSMSDRPIKILHFWATWCTPCIKEIVELNHFVEKLEIPQVDVYFIAIKDNNEEVSRYLIKNKISTEKINIHWLIDSEGDLLKKFKSVKVPETYIFGKQKQFLKKFIGPQNWDNSFYLREIDKLKTSQQ